MKIYGPKNFHTMPRAARTIVTLQLAAHEYILRDDGQILSFTGEVVARLIRVEVTGRKVDWFVQMLRSMTIIEIEVPE